MIIDVRLVRLDDVVELTDVLIGSRAHLAPWDPERGDAYFTGSAQRQVITEALGAHERGTMVPLVMTVADGAAAQRFRADRAGSSLPRDRGRWQDHLLFQRTSDQPIEE
jgi:hypothetical protein